MIFTDEDGKKYEESGEFGATVNDQRHFVIRPIEEPKKWEVNLASYEPNSEGYRWILTVPLSNITEAQAELIKDGVFEVMGYIMGDLMPGEWGDAVDKARKALQS